jgi:DNA-binding LacI/PurR family transcriptional regulator
MLGALFYTTGISDPSLQALLEPLAACSKPFTALDESSSVVLARLAQRHAGFRLHLLGQGGIHGELMGRHLLGLGHRSVCYVSPMHGSPWSQRRLVGLRTAFAAAGAPDVAAVTSLSVSASGPSPRLRTVTRRTIGVLRRFAGLAGSAPAGGLATVIQQLREEANEIVDVAIPRRDLRRLFARAAGLPGCTAWVGANDMVAREMLVYLREQGRDVPGDISVAGFDDTEREFRQDLTSYNFNLPAIVRGMLGHVLDWRPARAALKASGPVELEGFVCPRRTTARARPCG